MEEASKTQQEILRLENISKWFDSPEGRLKVVNNVSLSVNSGEIISIVGPSGCGKSTLLRLLSSILEPSEGQRLQLTEDEPTFGFAFQHPALLPWRTVAENVLLPQEICGQRPEPVDKLLQQVGLEGFSEYKPSQLSGGMKQRLALARALSIRPTILCLDEPFSSLDELLKHELHHLVQKLHESYDFATILVTHDIQEALFLSQRIIVLSARPAKIVGVYENNLRYPRTEEYRYSEDLIRSAGKIREILGR